MNNPHYIDIGQHPNDIVKSLCVYLSIDTLIFGLLCIIGIKPGLNHITFFFVGAICITTVFIFLQYSHKKRLVISEIAIFLIENKKDCIYKRILRWSDIKYIGYYSESTKGYGSYITHMLYIRIRRKGVPYKYSIETIKIDLRDYFPYKIREVKSDYINNVLEPLCRRKNIQYFFDKNECHLKYKIGL